MYNPSKALMILPIHRRFLKTLYEMGEINSEFGMLDSLNLDKLSNKIHSIHKPIDMTMEIIRKSYTEDEIVRAERAISEILKDLLG